MTDAHSDTESVLLRPIVFPRDQAAFMTLLSALYPSIPEDTLQMRLHKVREGSWECIGAFTGDGPETMVGMSGYWIQHRLCYGRFLYVDHFIVSNEERTRGVGKRMWQRLEQTARERGCERIVLDTFVTNSVAQRFWMNQGCGIVGFHFGNSLQRGTP